MDAGWEVMGINYDNFVTVTSAETQCSACPIRQFSLFKNLSDISLVESQQSRKTQYRIKAKRRLLEEGQHNKYTYTLFSGWAAIYQTADNGERQICRFALPGDFIGYQSDLNDPIYYSAQAITDITVCAFPKEEMQSLLTDNKDVTSRLLEMHSRNMRLSQQYMLSLGRKSAKQRLAFLLLELYQRIKNLGLYIPGSYDNSIAFPLSQEDIADATGLTAVHVSRTLRQIMDEGHLEVKNRRLTIYKEEALGELAQFNKSMVTDN